MSTFTIIQWLIPLAVLYFIFHSIRKNKRRKRIKIANRDNPPSPQEKSDSPIVTIDEQYIKTEKELFYDIIRKKIERYHQDSTQLTTRNLKIKRAVLTVLLGIVTFTNSIWILMALYPIRPVFVEILAIIFYLVMMKNCNIVHYIYKRFKKNPDSNMDIMLADVEMIPITLRMLTVVLLILTVVIAIAAAYGISFLQLGFGPEDIKWLIF